METEPLKPDTVNEDASKRPVGATVAGNWHKLDGFDGTETNLPARARLEGEVILIFPFGGGFRGVERACPHQKANLAQAVLMANGTVLRCPHHNFTFKLSDGKGVSPSNTKLRIFDIKVEDGIAYGRPAN